MSEQEPDDHNTPTAGQPEEEDADHDGGYRKLFELPALVLALLALCPGLGLPTLDTAQMTRVPASSLPARTTDGKLKRRHGDCIWRIPRHDAPGHDLYVLIEFQSSVTHAMPMRMLEYTARLALALFDQRAAQRNRRRRNLRHPWPLVLPIVLYNGLRPWTAPCGLRPPHQPGALERFQPSADFLLLDLGRMAIPPLEALPDNPLRTLFQIEQRTLRDPNLEIDTLFDLLVDQLQRHPDALALRAAFLTFFKVVILRRGVPISSGRLQNLSEAKHMLHNLYDIAHKRGRKEGRQEGRQEGHQEGRQEGRQEELARARQTTLELIKRKFGVNGDTWRARLDPMSAEQLQDFLLRAALADTLSELDD
jgi:hypothetical protein